MSRTIGSPARMMRSVGWWWGEAEFGPLPTIANDASSWPSATRRSRTSRLTSSSVRPMSLPRATCSTTRSAAWAAARSISTSSGSFTIRPSRRTSETSETRAVGIAAPSRRTNDAQSRSETANAPTGSPRWRAPRSTIAATRSNGSSVSSHGTTATVSASTTGSARAAIASRRGTTSVGIPRAGTTSIVSRSSGQRPVAREVDEVRADADEERVEARLDREVAGVGEPMCETAGPDGGPAGGHRAGGCHRGGRVACRPQAGGGRGAGQGSTVQVSPPPSAARRSPRPSRRIASSTWPWRSASWVVRETFRMTPTGTGNSGQ